MIALLNFALLIFALLNCAICWQKKNNNNSVPDII